jgi:hypothetical protein
MPRGPNRDLRLQGFHYCSSWMRCLGNNLLNSSNGLVFVCHPLLRSISCLATCYLATTRSLLFVVTGTWLPIRCSAMDVCSGSTIPALSHHVTIFISEWEQTWELNPPRRRKKSDLLFNRSVKAYIPSDVTNLLWIYKLSYIFWPVLAIIRSLININWKHRIYSQYI